MAAHFMCPLNKPFYFPFWLIYQVKKSREMDYYALKPIEIMFLYVYSLNVITLKTKQIVGE